MTETKTQVGIEVTADGPYHVTGGIKLVRVDKITNEKKEHVGWQVYEEIGTEDEYWLCRCGQSTTKPFCSDMHLQVGFDGTETAQTNSYADRAEILGGTKVTVRDDRGICAHAAFCSNRMTNVWKAAPKGDDDENLREMLVEMISHCPSGALTVESDGAAIEPDLPVQIAVQKDASYLVTSGQIPITRPDGQHLEIRNRMALCRCGQSKNKPLCDGSHFDAEFKDG
ncbi:MAG: CDGSH iron-sulfur domain-containing protein [Actinomycetota bacterium]